MGQGTFRRTVGISALSLVLAMASATTAAADGQRVVTKSGKMRCAIYANFAGTGPGSKAYVPSGSLVMCAPYWGANDPRPGWMGLAVVTSTGNFSLPQIELGIPQPDELVMNYGQTYNINGWTVMPTQDGTRFTNDGTGHGMFVNYDTAYGF